MNVQRVIDARSASVVPSVSMIESWVRRLLLEQQWYATLRENAMVVPLPMDLTGLVMSYCLPNLGGMRENLTGVLDRIRSAMEEDSFDIQWYDGWTRDYTIAHDRLQESRVLYRQIDGILQLVRKCEPV